MRKIGLALSGGGFRATLYHLGLVRFLRDAGILPNVTHITSVSGGSILAAHLALNWDRYNGSANDFDAAAAELLAFVRLDVRNRIVRRFPLAAPLRWLQRLLLLGSNRALSRAGLLEDHYRRYLYGDTSLSELPARPQLHILATNLSEGCICSFNRNGLLIQRRQADGTFRFDHLHIGLATVPMAVAASSAFPAFFPPLELSGADVGAPAGAFPVQAFTDGGVFDNLGVRLFRCLERTWLAEAPLTRHDFLDFDTAAAALAAASTSGEETPLRRLAQVLVAPAGQPTPLLLAGGGAAAEPLALAPPAGAGDGRERLLSGLSDLLLHYQFHREPLFAALKLEDTHAQALLHRSRSNGRTLDIGDQAWMNRHLLEAAFHLATGIPCFRRLNSGLDGVLVSDVGKSFEVQGNGRAGGLIRTAVRATDILMDRVWQLEKETFGETPGFTFAPITGIIDPADDPTALPPEVQRQAANIRTDLDRFSPLEISSLVRHGYCVGRQACRSRPELFGANLPADTSWDPAPAPPSVPAPSHRSTLSRVPTRATVEARTLQASALRRIWSTLLDYRDWVSYIYVPLLVPILVVMPYLAVKSYQRSHRMKVLIESLAGSGPELEEMTRLLDRGPEPPWVGVEPEEVGRLDVPDFKGFEVLEDSCIIDLRAWGPARKGEAGARTMVMRHLRVHKLTEHHGTDPFRIPLLSSSPRVAVRFPPQQLDASLRVSRERGSAGNKRSAWEVVFDFGKVPPGEVVDLVYNCLIFRGEEDGEMRALHFPVQVATAELKLWMLMPEGKEYQQFGLIRYRTDQPGSIEAVKLAAEYLAEDATILALKVLALNPGYTYELRWKYKR